MTQPKAPQQSKHSEESEVHSGSQAFGFFHKHQKLIIYTAGIFTLLTFSVTGALLGSADRFFGDRFKGATMDVPGIGEVVVTKEDLEAAKGISQIRAAGLRLMVFPEMSFGDEASVQYIDQLAALHALAVATGIEASDDDVETVLQAAIKTYPSVNSMQDLLAASTRNRDETLFRHWVRQALRVATFVRLSTLGVAQSHEATVARILDDNEQIAFDVVYVDAKGFKENLKKGLDEATLKKYLEDLDDVKSERYRKPANKASVKIAMLEDGVFKHEDYLDNELEKDAQVGANEIQDRYIRDREDRYKLPKKETPKKPDDKKPDDKKPGEKKGEAGGNKGETPVLPTSVAPQDAGKTGAGDKTSPKQDDPKAKQDAGKKPDDTAKQNPPPLIGADPNKPAGDPNAAGQTPDNAGGQAAQDEYKQLDDALRAKIKEQIFAEQVLAKWQAALDKRMAKHMEQAINDATKAEIAVEDAKTAKAEVDTELEKKPDDAELKKKAESSKKKVEEAEAAAKKAKEAVETRRKAFDFETAIKELAKGKDGKSRSGLKIVDVAEMKDAEGMKELPEVGKWRDSHLPGQMSLAGEIHNGRVQSTEKGVFIFQVSDIEARPFKEFKEIKDDLETDYLTEKAEAETKTKKEAFEKVLERLAREKLKDEIAKLEKEGADDIEKQFTDWKTDLETKIAADDKWLAANDPQKRSYKGITLRRDGFKKELDGADEKRKTIKEAVDKKTKEKVEEKLEEVHKDVMVAAGKEAKLEVKEIGPFSRKLSETPRFKHSYSNVVQALFGDSDIVGYDEGDTTEFKEDALNEVTFMASCKKVEQATATQISRRQWLALRSGTQFGGSFAGNQMQKALDQSYTVEALKAGFKWTPPKSLEKEEGETEQGPAGGKGDKGKGDKDKGDKKGGEK